MKTELFFDYESPACTMLEMAPVEILCSSAESFEYDDDYILI